MPQREDAGDAEESAWRQIVENYGERAELPPEPAYGFEEEPFDPYDDPDGESEGEEFVPPEPEPLQLSPVRTAAWAGVLGAPLVALLATVVVSTTGLSVPAWFGWLLVAAFLGGFGYLVLTMPKDRDDPWDDGARL